MTFSLPRLVILDRDGVINQDYPQGCTSIQDFILLPRVIEAIKLLNDHSIPVVIATNQALVGRGVISLQTLESIHVYMRTLLHQKGATLGTIYFCTDTEIPPYFRRKPAPGMLIEAMTEHHIEPQHTIFIGDAKRDLEAAQKAGCTGILVRTGKGMETLKTLPPDFKNTLVYDDLYSAIWSRLNS